MNEQKAKDYILCESNIPIEAIKELKASGKTYKEIAYIYGWE